MSIETLNGLANVSAARINSGSHQRQKSEEVEVSYQAVKVQQAESAGVLGHISEEKIEKEAAVEEKQQQNLKGSESLAELVGGINEQPSIKRRSLHFSIHEETGQTVVQVHDLDTEELIRQIPPEEVIEIAERVREFHHESKGLMLRNLA